MTRLRCFVWICRLCFYLPQSRHFIKRQNYKCITSTFLSSPKKKWNVLYGMRLIERHVSRICILHSMHYLNMNTKGKKLIWIVSDDCCYQTKIQLSAKFSVISSWLKKIFWNKNSWKKVTPSCRVTLFTHSERDNFMFKMFVLHLITSGLLMTPGSPVTFIILFMLTSHFKKKKRK